MKKSPNTELPGDEVQSIRETLGLTRQEMAFELGVTERYLRSIESCERRVTRTFLANFDRWLENYNKMEEPEDEPTTPYSTPPSYSCWGEESTGDPMLDAGMSMVLSYATSAYERGTDEYRNLLFRLAREIRHAATKK